MLKNSTLKGYVYIIASAVIFGCMPLMTELIYAEGINSMSLVFLRNVFALPILVLVAAARGERIIIERKSVLSVALIALLGCALTPFLLFTSYYYLPSGTATVLHFIYPVTVVLLEMVFIKKKMNLMRALSLAFCVGGIALFYTPGVNISLTGIILAISSGVTYALYIFLLGIFKKKDISSFVFSFFVSAFAAVAMLAVCLATGGLTFPKTLTAIVLCILFAILINVGAVLLFQRGTFLIGGDKSSILSTLEPITSVVVGILILNDFFSINVIIGSVLVVISSVLIAVCDMKSHKR